MDWVGSWFTLWSISWKTHPSPFLLTQPPTLQPSKLYDKLLKCCTHRMVMGGLCSPIWQRLRTFYKSHKENKGSAGPPLPPFAQKQNPNVIGRFRKNAVFRESLSWYRRISIVPHAAELCLSAQQRGGKYKTHSWNSDSAWHYQWPGACNDC